jgi:hypothetical protein
LHQLTKQCRLDLRLAIDSRAEVAAFRFVADNETPIAMIDIILSTVVNAV